MFQSISKWVLRIGSLVLFIPGLSWATCNGLGCTCIVAALPLSLGNYSITDSSPTSNSVDITVTCTAISAGLNVSYSISLGTGGANSYSPRKLSHLLAPSNKLNYNLYTDASFGQVWGDGSGGTGVVSDSYNVPLLIRIKTYPVNGRIPPLQNAIAGAYSDNVVVSVTY